MLACLILSAGAAAQLPDWVPDTVGRAGFVPMTNTLDDVDLIGVWSGSSAGDFCAYSGGCYNPYYGPLGAHIVHGGGHAANNDNSVFIANYNTLAFERVGGPTQLPTVTAYDTMIMRGGFPDDETNPREYESGVPGSAHTYDCLLTLPPSVCGDPLGALIRPVSSAVGAEPSRSSGWAHVFTFTDRQWTRWSTNYARSWTPGGTCAYDTQRDIIWPISEANMNYRAYLTLSTRTYTNIWEHNGLNGYPDMVYSTYCGNRDIIVIATNNSEDTAIKMFWFPAGSTGDARNRVTFSSGLLPKANWGRGSIVYVPELQKVIYWSQYDIDTYYEIDVPADPSTPWSWSAKSITGPARPSTLSPTPYGSTYHRMDYAAPLQSLVWVTGQSTYGFGGRVVCIRVVPDDGSSIETAAKAPETLRAWPNPFSTRVHVNLQGQQKAVLYNAAGVPVRSFSGSEIGTGELPSGVYFMKAKLGKSIITQKLVKF